jgi:hypothetical protein
MAVVKPVCGLTSVLSRREPADGPRRRRKLFTRACGAPELAPTGRLERVVIRHHVREMLFDHSFDAMTCAASLDERTGITSKSTRSAQALIHVSNRAGFSVRIS